MKKFTTLLTTLLTALMVVTIAGTNVFADTATIETSGGTTSVDVNYDCEFTSKDKNDGGPTGSGDYSIDDVKKSFYVTVEKTVTNGKVKVNHSYNQTSGVWSAVDTVYDKTSGSAYFKVTNYSYDPIKAVVSFAPNTSVAKAISDETLNVESSFDANFGTSVFTAPTSYKYKDTTKTVEFLDNVAASALSSGTNVSKMGTFTVTVTKVGSPS